MAAYSFSLIPFPSANIPDIKIRGSISRKQNFLAVHYELTGEIENIFFSETSSAPLRKDDLWRTTCFEFFLAIPGKPEYWEFNMSPSGDWNVYHMDSYRQVGLRQETSIERLQFSVENRADYVIVEAAINLNFIVPEEEQIQAGITSVIEDKNQHETYWALVHPGLEPDFHRREGFILELAE